MLTKNLARLNKPTTTFDTFLHKRLSGFCDELASAKVWKLWVWWLTGVFHRLGGKLTWSVKGEYWGASKYVKEVRIGMRSRPSCGWDLVEFCRWDLEEWWERLTANAEVPTALAWFDHSIIRNLRGGRWYIVQWSTLKTKKIPLLGIGISECLGIADDWSLKWWALEERLRDE
jgi:hypothetical protein